MHFQDIGVRCIAWRLWGSRIASWSIHDHGFGKTSFETSNRWLISDIWHTYEDCHSKVVGLIIVPDQAISNVERVFGLPLHAKAE